jgi:hypothetical protein
MAVALLQVTSYIVSEDQPVVTQSILHWIATTKTCVGMVLKDGNDMIFIPAEATRWQIGALHDAESQERKHDGNDRLIYFKETVEIGEQAGRVQIGVQIVLETNTGINT